MSQSKYIGTTEAAQMTGLSIKEILSLLHDGTIPSHRTRRGHYRLLPEDLENLGLVKQKTESPIVEDELEEEEPFVEEDDEELEEDGFSYIQDEEHFTDILPKMAEVKSSLKIATADLQNVSVAVQEKGKIKMVKLYNLFLSLVERGVNVQVVCMKPFGFYNNVKENCPQLLDNPLFELRWNEHNHMKMFIFDNECAYFGSANITSAAVGRRTSKQRNYEAGMLVWGTNMMKVPLQHFEWSWNDPCIIKHTWKRFVAKAKELEKKIAKRNGN
jgi:excisionase family DNA binding protein